MSLGINTDNHIKENAIEGIESIEIVIENSHTIENWEEFKTIFDEIFSDI